MDIECILVGGPLEGEALILRAMDCREELGFEVGWCRAQADGGVAISSSQRPRNVEWLSATRAVYRKAAPASGGKVVYQFDRIVEILRCSRILEGKGRQCRHEAVLGDTLCNTHRAKR